MSSTNPVLHKALLKAGVATALLATAAPALAQEQSASIDTIVVTGSRIARPELLASSPVSILGSEEFKFSGSAHVEEVLHELPQVIPSQGAASNNPGSGAATVNLRGLGATRTLVLVNGRRYVYYDENQIVDLNTIPSTLIERVELVTGGRSAVYGSDAIAGVVNFVMKQDFEGVEVGGNYRVNEKGDGDTYTIDGVIGGNFADGRGNVTAYISYSKRASIMASARSFSRTVQVEGPNGTLVPGGSSAIPHGAFTAGGRSYIANNGNLLPHDGTTYNFAPDNYLQVPNERWFISASAKYEINDHVEAFAELQYVNSLVSRELAPTPVSDNFYISVDNPYLSAAAQEILRNIDANETGAAQNDGRALVNVSRRMNESGPRHQDDDRHAFRALIGLRGDIGAGWAYEGYYSFARNRNVQTQEGNISKSRFQQALLTNGNACSNTANGCVPLNIFGLGVANPDGVAFVTVNSTNLNVIQSQVFNFSVNNGQLFDLGAGPAGIALGAEWRSERGAYRPDTYLASGDVLGFNAGEPTKGGYSVKELFGEVVVPLLSGLPFVHKLEFDGAVRYADYSNKVGSAWAYSAGVSWAPIEDITFRGQYQRAVRAPTVSQLFAGQAVNFPSASDPCQTAVAITNTTLRQTCIANGYPESMLGQSLPTANSQIRSLIGGNPELTEEKSDTYTIGAVIQPRFLPRLSLTVDYYNISIDDYISAPGTTAVIAACYGNAANNFAPYDSSMCALAPRNPLTSVLEDVLSLNANLGKLKTEGVDFEARYFVNVPFGFENDGRLDFRLSGTRLIHWELNTIASIPSLLRNCTGRVGISCGDPYSRWRWNFRTTYSTGPISVSFSWFHIGSARDDNDGAVRWREKVGGYDKFDLAASYDLNDTLSLAVGVNNVFNKKPPLFSDANDQQNGTYPQTYDVFGRQYFFSARAHF